MAGAPSLAGLLPLIPPFFHPVCVQLDMHNERTVTGPLDRATMAASEALEGTATSAWVDNPGVFTHRGTPGWFFLGGARLPSPQSSAAAPAPLYDGTSFTLGTSGANVYLEVPVAATTAAYVEFIWPGPSGPLTAGFSVGSAVPGGMATRMVLWGNDVTPGFTGHDADGSSNHAYKTSILYFPQHELPAGSTSLVAGGFGVPSSGVQLKVYPPGATETWGLSPTVPNASTGTGEFFAGRTVVFTETTRFSTGSPPVPRPDFNQRALSTVVHEFLHAFGMPHKCGQWDWRTPRDRSCCMNYWNTWLVTPANRLIAGFDNRQGDHMCGRHLMEVRRVHLERNAGLRW